VVAVSAKLRDIHKEKTWVVITHGGVIRAILAEMLGLPDAKIFCFDQSYGAINVIDRFDDTPSFAWSTADPAKADPRWLWGAPFARIAVRVAICGCVR
jgi:broad specificity phosphatase PhoE